jgi:general secretion pathway protein A
VALLAGAWYVAPEPWREKLQDTANGEVTHVTAPQVAAARPDPGADRTARPGPDAPAVFTGPEEPAVTGVDGRPAAADAHIGPDPGAGTTLPVGGYASVPEPDPVPARLDPDWLDRQHEQSWQAIAGLWKDGGSAYAVQSACDGAARTGFACVRDHGNWSRIRQLGLPVLLVLREAEPRLVLLRGFSGDALLLGSPGQERSVPRNRVEEHWLGEFLVIWPQAPDWPAEIRRGETGAAVDIVMEMAGRAEPAWYGDRQFDVDFEDWLTAFQRRNGLKADGIIGPNTLIHLMAPTIDEPRLLLKNEESS